LDDQEERMASGRFARYRFYLRHRPVILAMLSVAGVLFFLAVTGLSRVYHAQRQALGDRWFARGMSDLKAKQYETAIMDFRSALLYSRDDPSYQLNLAEALIGMKRSGEASAYLLNLWEREPENGLVNLELARIAAQQGQTEQAVRYYHDAVYSAWPGEQEPKRRDARFELVELLLGSGRRAEAQAEMIALAENAGSDPAEQAELGDLFLRTGDAEHALAAFRVTLRTEKNNVAALAGAGQAAFELGRYPLAQRYLQSAVAGDLEDTQSAERLKMTETVLRMDPFQRQISATERNRAVLEAFATAGQRLKACPVRPAPGSGPSSADEWASLSSSVTNAGLRANPDLVESAMDVVFRIERETSLTCGEPTGPDQALLLISRLHEGN